MSLVNDALKRARQSQPKNAPAADGPPLRPAEQISKPGPAAFLPGALVLVVLVLGGLLLMQWFQGSEALKVRAHTISPAAQPTIAPTPAFVVNQSPAAPSPVVPAPVVTTKSAVETVQGLSTLPPKPQAPTYKLQSVFYLPKSPAAVINGKSVSIGSKVGGAKVLAITPGLVTILTPSGQTNVLSMQ